MNFAVVDDDRSAVVLQLASDPGVNVHVYGVPTSLEEVLPSHVCL